MASQRRDCPPTAPPRRATPRRQRVRSGFVSARAVGSFVPKLTHKAFEKYGFSTAALITDWATIVGTDLAAYTAPERLKWPRGVERTRRAPTAPQGARARRWSLRVEPARALDVQYKARQIIERINAYFGYARRGRAAHRAGAAAGAPGRRARARRRRPCRRDPELAGITDERAARPPLARLKSGADGPRPGALNSPGSGPGIKLPSLGTARRFALFRRSVACYSGV